MSMVGFSREVKDFECVKPLEGAVMKLLSLARIPGYDFEYEIKSAKLHIARGMASFIPIPRMSMVDDLEAAVESDDLHISFANGEI